MFQSPPQFLLGVNLEEGTLESVLEVVKSGKFVDSNDISVKRAVGSVY